MQITINGTTHNATTVQEIVDTLQTLQKCRVRYSFKKKKLVTINAYQITDTACADIKATIPIETDDNLHDIALALEDCCNKPCIFDGDMSEGWFQFIRIY